MWSWQTDGEWWNAVAYENERSKINKIIILDHVLKLFEIRRHFQRIYECYDGGSGDGVRSFQSMWNEFEVEVNFPGWNYQIT